MPLTAVVLDTGPLGLATQRIGKSLQADACISWMQRLLRAGVRVYVPEIADYEVRRELLRVRNAAGISRLNKAKELVRYLPITTDIMLMAADLWADARRSGLPTADTHSVDGDVILAAQALSLGLAEGRFVVATGNVKHLSRFVPSAEWTDIETD